MTDNMFGPYTEKQSTNELNEYKQGSSSSAMPGYRVADLVKDLVTSTSVENAQQERAQKENVEKTQNPTNFSKLLTLLRLTLFNNLSRQVAAIHRGRADRLTIFIRGLFILACLIYIGRYVVGNLCMYLRIKAYLVVDLQNRFFYYRRSYHQNYFLQCVMACLFSLYHNRLVALLYFCRPDRLVWSHLYDLVVRNRHPEKAKANLLHYPFLVESDRRWAARVTAFFEGACTVAMAYHQAFNLWGALQYARKWMWRLRRATALQHVFFWSLQLAYRLYLYQTWVVFLLVMLCLLLVCTLYTEQYRRLNGQLRRVMLLKGLPPLLTGKKQTWPNQNQRNRTKAACLDSLQLSRATASYRALHTRLTVFILRYNESIVCRVIAYFVRYLVPAHGYIIVKLYLNWATRQTAATFFALNQVNFILLLVFELHILLLTFFIARVNAQIARSGPILGSILARKGVLMTGGKVDAKQRRHSNNNNWVRSTFDTFWRREMLKLSVYYELVWRAEKPLAFTTGQGDAPMDWKYVAELTFFNTTVVLFFLSKFINREDGLKI